MVDTALQTENEKREYFDPPELLEEKIELLAEMVKHSKFMIAFTGAGISTSSGIPDYRSGVGTVLNTGPGEWEKKSAKSIGDKTYQRKNMTEAQPTTTHMAFVALEKDKKLKGLISQNIDGLHRRSGISPTILSELHGNINIEICKKCNKSFLREFNTRSAKKESEHITPRFCDEKDCKAPLYDSIINFGEKMPEREIKFGFEMAEKADLCLALGSSLRVSPAADIPSRVALRKKNLVIINLQKTPLDNLAALNIHAMCDDVLERLMKKLKIQIPEYQYVRTVEVEQAFDDNNIPFISISTSRPEEDPKFYFKLVTIKNKNGTNLLEREPLKFICENKNYRENGYDIQIQFEGGFKEHLCSISIKSGQLKEKLRFRLGLDIKSKKWAVL